MRTHVGRTALAAGALLLIWTGSVGAFSYYPPTPQGRTGLSRPTIVQRLKLGAGERVKEAGLWIDGVAVSPTWDQSGRVRYTPEEPLPAGKHQLRLVIQVDTGRARRKYRPLESEFSLIVEPGAVAALPTPGPEEWRALAHVNTYRRAAGLPILRYDPVLGASALNHARYLAANPGQVELSAHGERPGLPHYTGETLEERTDYFGYEGGGFEVINYTDRAEEAVDGWMETIYHRIPLLHPGVDAMGYGLAGSHEGRVVNVINAGPYDATHRIVRWPAPGQAEVPTSWDGRERPNPLSLYPDVTPPVGYPITAIFGGRLTRLRLTEWSLTGPGGPVAVLPFDPQNDLHLTDTVAIIPEAPLAPATSYTAHLSGVYDAGNGLETFVLTWSFTTAAAERPAVSRWITTYDSERNVRTVRLEGTGLRQVMAAFLDGLPVEDLLAEGETLSFRPPVGVEGPSDLLLVTAQGDETDVEELFAGDEGYQFPEGAAFTAASVYVQGRPLGAVALRHLDGAILLPESVLTALGGTQSEVGPIQRHYWRFGERSGEYTLGRTAASIDGQPVRLKLPVRESGGGLAIDAAFIRRLAGVEIVEADGALYVETPATGASGEAGG